MGKRSTLTAEPRAQLVLRLLSKEEPAAQIARRAGGSEETQYRWLEEFIEAGKQAMNGRGAKSERTKVLERLRAEDNQVIGELTIANRLLKDSDASSGAPKRRDSVGRHEPWTSGAEPWH